MTAVLGSGTAMMASASASAPVGDFPGGLRMQERIKLLGLL